MSLPIMKPSPTLLKRTVNNALSLEEFLFRQQVKGIYKRVMKLIYHHHERDGLLDHLRHEFKLHQSHDLQYRKYLLNKGIGQINDMSNILGLNLNL